MYQNNKFNINKFVRQFLYPKSESITLSDKNTLLISGNQLYTDSTYNINDMENVEYLKNEGFTNYIIYINFSK